jgi:hypothetical protein
VERIVNILQSISYRWSGDKRTKSIWLCNLQKVRFSDIKAKSDFCNQYDQQIKPVLNQTNRMVDFFLVTSFFFYWIVSNKPCINIQ